MISKEKVMLQIPVKKGVAKTFKEVADALQMNKGDLFTIAFAEFLHLCEGRKQDGEEKVKN